MLTGTTIKLLNFINSRKFLFIFIEFIPEFLILGCSFGYLCFMIIYKWCVNWPAARASPPDLLKTMTDYFLAFYTPIPVPLYAGQSWVQITLFAIVVLSIPVLLLATPTYELIHHLLTKKKKSEHVDPTEHEFNFQEIAIHQLIHTIEYVIGTVSNTASYLRLWALSLAHSQLSEVFFQLTIRLLLSLDTLITGLPLLVQILDYTGIPIFIGYTIWILLTLGVLLMMESLSAFLHSLRLHWVEFNSKYYKGEGIPFNPLSFEDLLKRTRAKIPEKVEL